MGCGAIGDDGGVAPPPTPPRWERGVADNKYLKYMDNYVCAVCGGEYEENDVSSTFCCECGKRVCIYCIEYDGNTDVCDVCVDEQMF